MRGSLSSFLQGIQEGIQLRNEVRQLSRPTPISAAKHAATAAAAAAAADAGARSCGQLWRCVSDPGSALLPQKGRPVFEMKADLRHRR